MKSRSCNQQFSREIWERCNMEEIVFIPNKKELKLAAIIHKPEGKGKFPGVIVLHGFAGRKDEPHIKVLCEDLAENGFAAIRFETAGLGESEGSIEEFLLTNYYNDVDVIFEYFSKLDFVDAERIGMVGHSLGATLTLLYAAKNIGVKALCAISPFAKFSHTHLEISMQEWQEKGFYPKKKANGTTVQLPYAFVEDADKAEVLELVRALTQPKMIVVATTDDVVDPEETKAIYEHAAEPKKLVEIADFGHMYKENPEQIKDVDKRIVAFFQETL